MELSRPGRGSVVIGTGQHGIQHAVIQLFQHIRSDSFADDQIDFRMSLGKLMTEIRCGADADNG